MKKKSSPKLSSRRTKLKTRDKQPNAAIVGAWRELSSAVGDFIRYWGFRRVHGEIWVQLFLSDRGLSGAELVRRLGVSKALVSPALAELQGYGLIRLERESGRNRIYVASEDVVSVIQKVLRNREAKILERASRHFQKLERRRAAYSDAGICGSRVAQLGDFFQFASVLLHTAQNLPLFGGKNT